MISTEQILTLFTDIENFLFPEIDNNKCVLVVGARNSGKTCLIKYFSGVAFTRQTNQEDLPYLVQNPDVVPENPVKMFKKQKISLELTTWKSLDANSQQVTFIEMPSFASLTSQVGSEQDPDGVSTFNKIIYGIFVWNTVLNLSKQVHIFLLTPYQFITDDHKLVQFFSTWQKFLIQNQESRSQIKQCLTIIFTKPEYEDDKESLITSLDHLSQAGSQEIGLNNSFSSAAQASRVFCFLSQDTEEGKGVEMLAEIMGEADFYGVGQNGLLAQDWMQSFMWSLIKEAGDQKLKVLLKNVEAMFKKIMDSEEHTSKTLDRSLSILGNAALLSLTKTLPKQTPLKKRQQQLQSQLKTKSKPQPILTAQLLQKISTYTQKPPKPDKYLESLLKISLLIQSGIKQQILIDQMLQNIEEEFWKLFNIAQECKNTIGHWVNQRTFVWKYPAIFWKLCLQHKDNAQIHHEMQAIEDLNKEMTKKIGAIAKNKITNGLRHYEVLGKIGEIKGVAEGPAYKQLLAIFGAGDGDEQGEEEEQVSGPSDPRVKRWYFKTEQNPDFFTVIKQKSKKVVVKPQPKGQQVNQRQQIKSLLGSLQRQPQNRLENLQKLAKKLSDFKLYQFALQTYMDLCDPQKLFNFITQHYCSSEQKIKDTTVEYMRSVLIPYLEEKASIGSLYMERESVMYFVYAAQFCYDYLALHFADSAEEFGDICNFANSIQVSDQQEFDYEEMKDIQLPMSFFQTGTNKDMQFLKYISFSKAQIIQKINQRDQKNKKNGPALTQIKKLLEAPKIQLKTK